VIPPGIGGQAALVPEVCGLPADPGDLAVGSPVPPRARDHWTFPAGHHWTFPARRDQVGLARRALAAVLDGCPVAHDAIFCLSELAANAVLHSASGHGRGTFTVHAEIRPGQSVLIEVRDDGGSWQPGDDPDGRMHGLQIVEAIAAELAVWDEDGGRTVRVRLNWPAGQGAAP
jgi:anti-sigma regulatory factor (Ser/Thr protein kinase)